MRISDWSSDVCSSDLRVYSGEDRSIMSNHLFGPGKDIVAWAYQENPFKVVWSVRKDGALLAFTIVQSEEIGRASCRERVCQYVSISVVAVSLKKKKRVERRVR